MSITPASINDVNAFAPSSYLNDDANKFPALAPETELSSAAFSPSGFAATLQSGMAVLERRFTQFTRVLTRELTALEHQFSVAMRACVGAAKRADAANGTQPQAADAHASESASPYDGIIKRAAARNGLDPALVGAVVRQESGFRPDAVSSAGAVGLMQLMPSTAKGLGVVNPFDAAQNVDGGARLLRTLLDRYDGRLDFALAAYNAGPAAVDRYGGIPPYPETQSYVRNIMADYRAAALRTT